MQDSEEESAGLSTISGLNVGKNASSRDPESEAITMRNLLQESPEMRSKKRRPTNIQAFTDKVTNTKVQKEQSRA